MASQSLAADNAGQRRADQAIPTSATFSNIGDVMVL
ncbi:hypothetical protein X729_30990 [Mesorhizobium sp. L103C131B0]|nr:hypothetical protein X729_30990 [Mesorhizobium sp. L103C131B0]